MPLAACMALPPSASGTTGGAGAIPDTALPDVAIPIDEAKPAVPLSAPAQPSALAHAPVEMLVEVFQYLDLQTAFSLALCNRRLEGIFASHRTAIVLHIVQRDYAPLNGLLQFVKASPADLALPWGTWLDKRIRRRNVVLCPGGLTTTGPGRRSVGGNVAQSVANLRCAEVELTDADVDRMLAACRVVRGWEHIFPQHRFNASPLLTRSLSPRENWRLRRALYNWMRYAYYFHGDLPRPNVFVPAGRDVRVNQLRTLCNSQLSELKDLWRTVEDIVELSLCPSVDIVRMGADFQLSEKDAAKIGWGSQRENRTVVATMCKLSPEELLYYLENGHKFTKVRLIQDIRRRIPHIEADTESLTKALSIVSMERWRQMQQHFPGLVQDTGSRVFLPVYSRMMSQFQGGTLDWDDDEVEENLEKIGKMAGVGLDWQPEEFFGFRPEIPTGLLDA